MSADDQKAFGPKKRVRNGNPPVEYRFKPGQSGNPLGRPRKSSAAITTSSVDGAYLAEAKRGIRVKDEDGVRELPAIQVVARNQAMAAAKGNLKAQNDFAANTRKAEYGETFRREKLFESAIEYKAACEFIRDYHEKNRLPPPEFSLNPDHVIVNAVTRTVTLSVAAENIVMAACRELDDLRSQLRQDRQVLSTILFAFPDNPILLRDIQFVESLLHRLQSRK